MRSFDSPVKTTKVTEAKIVDQNAEKIGLLGSLSGKGEKKKRASQKKGCNRFSEASTLAKAFKRSIGKMESRAVPVEPIGGKAEFTVTPGCHTGR